MKVKLFNFFIVMSLFIALMLGCNGMGGKKNEDITKLKNIEIEKIVLGNPDSTGLNGKTVQGKDLNQDAKIEDFTVSNGIFPISVHHKTVFTAEKVEVSVNDGQKQALQSNTNKIKDAEYTLIGNQKTKFEIYITGEGYNPLKLTFNVTLTQFIDDITNIAITTSKDGKLKQSYGGAGSSIAELKDGKTQIDVSTAQPKIEITVNQGSEQKQAKAEITVDDSKIDADFAQGSEKLAFTTNALTRGIHSIKIKITKEGYKDGNYHFNLNYKPYLTFKELNVDSTKYSQLNEVENQTIVVEPTAPYQLTLSGRMQEDGASVYFSKQEGPDSEWIKIKDSRISVPEGEVISLRMYGEKEGYTTTFIPFNLKRKKTIAVSKIEVDLQEVKDKAVTIIKEQTKVKLHIYLRSQYGGITFKINNATATPTFDTGAVIATFNDVLLDKDNSKQFVLVAEAPDYISWTDTITVTHKTPEPEESYIVEAKIGAQDWDDDDFWIDYGLDRDGNNWKKDCSDGKQYRLTVKIQKKEKDISDPKKFKLSVVNKTNGDKVFFNEDDTGVKVNDKFILWKEMVQGKGGEPISFVKGVNDLEVKIYFDSEVIETTHFNINKK